MPCPGTIDASTFMAYLFNTDKFTTAPGPGFFYCVHFALPLARRGFTSGFYFASLRLYYPERGYLEYRETKKMPGLLIILWS